MNHTTKPIQSSTSTFTNQGSQRTTQPQPLPTPTRPLANQMRLIPIAQPVAPTISQLRAKIDSLQNRQIASIQKIAKAVKKAETQREAPAELTQPTAVRSEKTVQQTRQEEITTMQAQQSQALRKATQAMELTEQKHRLRTTEMPATTHASDDRMVDTVLKKIDAAMLPPLPKLSTSWVTDLAQSNNTHSITHPVPSRQTTNVIEHESDGSKSATSVPGWIEISESPETESRKRYVSGLLEPSLKRSKTGQ